MKSIKSGIIITILLLILVISPFISSCTPSPAGEVKTLKFGLITSVTGPLAPSFKGLYDAVKPSEDLLNQKGGVTVNGQKYYIKIVAEDDQSSPQGAIAATNKLLQENIKFIVSPLFPPALIAMTPIAEEAKVISINPLQIDPTLYTPQNKYSFNAREYIYGVPTIYAYLQKRYPNVKRLVTITPDDPGPNFILDLISKEVSKRGMQIVAQDKYPPTIQDFYPVLTKLLASKPDAIDGVGGIAPWGAGIINQAREMGFKGPIFGAAAFGDPNQIRAMVQNEYAYDFFQVAPDVLSDKMLPIVKELRKSMEQAGITFVMDNILVISSIMPVLQGIEEAQSFDTQKVVEAMEKMTNVETPLGKAEWKGTEYVGHNHMLSTESIPLSRFVDRKVEFEFLKR